MRREQPSLVRRLVCLAELDEAVAVAYGWPASIAQDADETNRRLLELNREIADGARPYDPFGYATLKEPRAAS